MADIEKLRSTAEDFNIVMKLNPPIDLELPEEDLTVLIRRAISLIDRTLDKFKPETEEVIAEFTKPKETIPTDRVNSLIEQVEDAQKITDLKEIATTNDEFKSLRDGLSKYKMAASLRDDMLDILENGKGETVPVESEHKSKKLEQNKGELVQETLSLEPSMTVTTMRPTKEIITRPPFSSLFPVAPDILEAVKKDMEKNGFDYAFPLVIWDETGVLLDGHTRLKAAQDLHISEVPVELKQFDNEKEALEYSIHNQRDRRNITDAELLVIIEAMDTIEKTGRKKAGAEAQGKTAERTARKLKTSEDKVSAARKVLKDPEAKKEVLAGRKSIRGAAKEIKKKERKEKEASTKAITRFQAIAFILSENKGSKIGWTELVDNADALFTEKGGKSNVEKMKSEVEFVLEILNALEITIQDKENNIIIASW